MNLLGGAVGDMITGPFSQMGGPLGGMGQSYNALFNSNVNPFSINSAPNAIQTANNILQPLMGKTGGNVNIQNLDLMNMLMKMFTSRL